MSRWHINNDTLEFSPHHLVERIRHDAVVAPRYKCGPHVLDVLKEVSLTGSSRPSALLLKKHLQKFLFFKPTEIAQVQA